MKLLISLLSLLLVAHGVSAQNVRLLRLTTPDDIGLAAAYYPVAADNAPAALLIHGAGQSRDELHPLALLLQRNGIATLNLDLRGHGQSTRRITAAGPELVDYRNFGQRDYLAMQLDVNSAVDWLAERPELNKKKLALIGAGIGANLALRQAAVNEDIAGLLLFSPGLNYRGIRTDDVMKKLGPVPLRIIVSQRDLLAFESAQRLVAIRKDEGHATGKELLICTGNLFGTELLRGVSDLPSRFIPWLRHILLGEAYEEPPFTPPPPPPAPPVAPAPKPKPKR